MFARQRPGLGSSALRDAAEQGPLISPYLSGSGCRPAALLQDEKHHSFSGREKGYAGSHYATFLPRKAAIPARQAPYSSWPWFLKVIFVARWAAYAGDHRLFWRQAVLAAIQQAMVLSPVWLEPVRYRKERKGAILAYLTW